ncbi:MAG TPA: DDE-type integrase/transposase/recombinase [Pseudonocardiaceae bacterium]|nr:DDE-type integrase/transposase/recombinase [Pseudonocardiaceae bacterium]
MAGCRPARERSGHSGHLRRDAKTATRFFRKLLTGLRSVPRVLVTDKLASYGVAHRRLMPGVEHRRSKHSQQLDNAVRA